MSRETLRAAVALEFALPENTTFILQPSLFTTFGWRKSLVSSGFGGATAGNEWNLLPVVHIERPFRFTRDRLRASVTVFPFLSSPGQDYEGTKTKVVVSYKFSRFMTGRQALDACAFYCAMTSSTGVRSNPRENSSTHWRIDNQW